ncbi:12452_t:CDS:2, partial [Ambispora leptoticha]
IIADLVNAGIFTTYPYSSITWEANQKYVVTWKDDGQAPSLKSLGKIDVDVVVGSDGNYLLAKNIAKQVPATALKTHSWNVPKGLGPAGAYYFIRYTSGENVAFSGKFNIQGISGNIAGFDPSIGNSTSGGPVGSINSTSSGQDPTTTDTPNNTTSTDNPSATDTGVSTSSKSSSYGQSSEATLNLNTFIISSIFLSLASTALLYL